MVFFNVNNLTGGDLTVYGLGMNVSNATMVNIYRKVGTHVGFETNAGAWTLIGTANGHNWPICRSSDRSADYYPCTDQFCNSSRSPRFRVHTPAAAQSYTNGTGANQNFHGRRSPSPLDQLLIPNGALLLPLAYGTVISNTKPPA
jgi:hypothetical protein